VKRIVLDKSVSFLLLIISLVAASVVFMAFKLKSDPFEQAVGDDRIMNIAFIVEKHGKPIATEIFMYYPVNSRGALLDIPAETGLIIKSLNRVDKIEVLYDPKNPKKYLDEISTLTGAVLPWYVIVDEKSLVELVDIMDGFEVFIPNQIITEVDKQKVLLPSGANVLDGSKMRIYATYQDEFRPEAETVARRQNVIHSLLSTFGKRSDYVLSKKIFPSVFKRLRTNLPQKAVAKLVGGLKSLDSERLVYQRLTGTPRKVEGVLLLFPHYDGELVRDIVRQTLNALLNTASFSANEKIFTLEIQNGTAIRGLAQKAADIFQSFGYEVISVGNAATQDEESTRIVNRYGDNNAVDTIANLIRCKKIESVDSVSSGNVPADFVIILGKNFNGRYCVD